MVVLLGDVSGSLAFSPRDDATDLFSLISLLICISLLLLVVSLGLLAVKAELSFNSLSEGFHKLLTLSSHSIHYQKVCHKLLTHFCQFALW